MPLKVMVDEDLPRQAVQLLREHGYDAASVVEQGMGGWVDGKMHSYGLQFNETKDIWSLLTKGLVISVFIHLERIGEFCF